MSLDRLGKVGNERSESKRLLIDCPSYLSSCAGHDVGPKGLRDSGSTVPCGATTRSKPNEDTVGEFGWGPGVGDFPFAGHSILSKLRPIACGREFANSIRCYSHPPVRRAALRAGGRGTQRPGRLVRARRLLRPPRLAPREDPPPGPALPGRSVDRARHRRPTRPSSLDRSPAAEIWALYKL